MRHEVLYVLCCFSFSGDRAVERALREKCCSVAVKLFANIAVLIYSTHVHGLELKKSTRSALDETGFRNIGDS